MASELLAGLDNLRESEIEKLWLEEATDFYALVAYATRYGSTREVAEYVGETLRGQGYAVEVAPAAAARDLGDYDAVVFGAPYYFGKMIKDGTAFLERHRPALESMPVALFALGPVSAPDDLAASRAQLDQTLAKLGSLKPRVVEMFVGRFDPAVLRGLDKLVTKLKASPLHGLGPHDDRDWAAIEAWARSLRLAPAVEGARV